MKKVRINEIINEFKEHDYQSFDEFYEMTNRLVYIMIAKIIKDKSLIEDLMQDTYVKFLENIKSVSLNANPTPYLAQIAKNLAINEINKYRKVELDDELVLSIKDDKDESESRAVELGIIDYLNGDDHEVVTMHIVGEMKFKEISKVMNKPLGTVLWIYNRAIKKLRDKVGDKDGK